MIKNEKQTVFSRMDRGDGLHERENSYGIYVDDSSGKVLNSKAVQKARGSE